MVQYRKHTVCTHCMHLAQLVTIAYRGIQYFPHYNDSNTEMERRGEGTL